MTDPLPSEPFSENQATHIFTTLVGELHLSYTALEHELSCAVYAVVTRFSIRRKDVLLAVLGGQRMGMLKETIKRLTRATKASPKRIAYVDGIFLQLGEIQFFRDRIAHYLTVISDYNPECWVNMNFTGVREREKMEDLHFNLFALKAAALDLQAMRPLVGGLFNHYLKGGSTRIPQLPAWQYKSSMLIRHRPISRGNQKRRKHPPQSSEV